MEEDWNTALPFSSDGSHQCIVVIVKHCVTPLKQKTIPRLELVGCLAPTRVYNTCQEALAFVNFKDYGKTWIDSGTVLSWIKTICISSCGKNSRDNGIRTIPLYPADALAGGIVAGDLKSWMLGPPFLRLPETEWSLFQDHEQSPHQERADA